MLSACTDNVILVYKSLDAYVSTTVATTKLLDMLGFVIHLVVCAFL